MVEASGTSAQGGSFDGRTVAARSFATSRKGLDPGEVKAFLADVGGEVDRLRARIATLESDLAAATEQLRDPARPTPEELDEASIVAAVGEEMAAMLRNAHATAGELRRKAAQESERVLTAANEQAAAAAARVRQAAAEESQQLVARAKVEAEVVRRQAELDRRTAIDGARSAREKILVDLARRRRVAMVQLEQLGASRERLLEAYAVVRRTLDEVGSELHRADIEATAAAEAAIRRLAAERGSEDEPLLDLPDLDLPELDLAHLGTPGPGGDATGPVAAPGTTAGPEVDLTAVTGGAGPVLSPVEDGRPGGDATEPTGQTPVVAATEPEGDATGPTPPVVGDPPEGDDGLEEDGSRELVGAGAVGRRRNGGIFARRKAGADEEQGITAEHAEAGIRILVGADASQAATRTVERPGAGRRSRTRAGGRPQFYDRQAVEESEREETTSGPGTRPHAPSGTSSGQATEAKAGPATTTEPGTGADEAAGAADTGIPRAEQPATAEPATAEPATAEPATATPTAPTSATAEPASATPAAPTPAGPAATVKAPRARVTATKAKRAEAAAEALPVEEAPTESKAATSPATEPPAADATSPATEPPATEPPVAAAPPSATASTPAPPTDAGDDGPPRHVGTGLERTEGDLALLDRRDAVVAGVESQLGRRLKRLVQDEHNDLLDRLRAANGRPVGPGTVLPSLDDQVAAWVDVAVPVLQQAAGAGRAFTAERLEVKVSALASLSEGRVRRVADSAVRSVIEPLAARLAELVADPPDGSAELLAESVGSAYRSARTQRIDAAAGDATAAVFALATWHAAPSGTVLRWVAEDPAGPCPDCDDDALAGAQRKGEAFPTGQLHPPAHDGCRCLLVPDRT